MTRRVQCSICGKYYDFDKVIHRTLLGHHHLIIYICTECGKEVFKDCIFLLPLQTFIN